MSFDLPVIHPPYRIFYNLSISFCAKSAARSIATLANLMQELSSEDGALSLDDIDVESVLDELQNIVLQGGAVSRYFWPVDKASKKRGEELRRQYHISHDSPLKSRHLRNAIEHFDERLDHYFSGSVVGTIIPHYVGPEPPPSQVKCHFFRAYYMDTGVFELLGHRYHMEPLSRELWRIEGGDVST